MLLCLVILVSQIQGCYKKDYLNHCLKCFILAFRNKADNICAKSHFYLLISYTSVIHPCYQNLFLLWICIQIHMPLCTHSFSILNWKILYLWSYYFPKQLWSLYFKIRNWYISYIHLYILYTHIHLSVHLSIYLPTYHLSMYLSYLKPFLSNMERYIFMSISMSIFMVLKICHSSFDQKERQKI